MPAVPPMTTTAPGSDVTATLLSLRRPRPADSPSPGRTGTSTAWVAAAPGFLAYAAARPLRYATRVRSPRRRTRRHPDRAGKPLRRTAPPPAPRGTCTTPRTGDRVDRRPRPARTGP